MKKKVYISGPMRGKKESESRHAFAEAQAMLESEGYIAIDPWDLQEYVPGLSDYESLHLDIEILMLCDAIYMLPGWTRSLGARQEFRTAVRHGKDIRCHEDAEPADYDI